MQRLLLDEHTDKQNSGINIFSLAVCPAALAGREVYYHHI